MSRCWPWLLLLALAYGVDGCRSAAGPTTSRCTPDAGGYGSHLDWLSFVEDARQHSQGNACLQMAWKTEGGGFEGASSALVRLEASGVLEGARGGSPFAGLQFPEGSGSYLYRFRIFALKASANRACSAPMKAHDYDCLRQSECRFFYELRLSDAAFRGRSLAVNGQDDLLCQAFFRASSPEPAAGEALADVDGGGEGECSAGANRACYEGSPETQAKGACKRGTQVCEASGRWGACEGQILPRPELCNGKDDDCNGKVDDNPTCSWLRKGGGEQDDLLQAVVATKQGDVYVAGIYQSRKTKFGKIIPGIPRSGREAFVAKLDAAGQWQWVQIIGGIRANVGAWSLAVDGNGDIYVAGFWLGSVTFGSTVGPTLKSEGHSRMYIAKISARGKWLWVQSVDSDSIAWGGTSMLASKQPGGLIFVTGQTSKKTSFGSITLENEYGQNGFVAAIDPLGRWQWVRLIPGGKAVLNRQAFRTPRLAFTAEEDLLVFSNYVDTPKLGSIQLPQGEGGKPSMVARLDKKGTWKWATTTHKGGLRLLAGALDPEGGITVGGDLRAGANLKIGSTTLDSEGFERAFLAYLSKEGTWLRGEILKGNSVQARITGLAHDDEGALYLIGNFSHEIEFGSIKLTSQPWLSHFLAKRSKDGTWLWAYGIQGFSTELDGRFYNPYPALFVQPDGTYYAAAGALGASWGQHSLKPPPQKADALVGKNIHLMPAAP